MQHLTNLDIFLATFLAVTFTLFIGNVARLLIQVLIDKD